MKLGISFESLPQVIERFGGREAMIARDKKATIESIIRAIREKPDEIIHWDVEDLPGGGLRVGGHIDFVSPNPEKDKPK